MGTNPIPRQPRFVSVSCDVCEHPVPRVDAGRPRIHCTRDCTQVYAAMSTLTDKLGIVETRATSAAWLRVRGEVWRLGNLRAWNRGPKPRKWKRKPRARLTTPDGCFCCGRARVRRPGSRGPLPLTCSDECGAVIEAIRILRNRLHRVADRCTTGAWHELRMQLWLLSNTRAWNKGVTRPRSEDDQRGT